MVIFMYTSRICNLIHSATGGFIVSFYFKAFYPFYDAFFSSSFFFFKFSFLSNFIDFPSHLHIYISAILIPRNIVFSIIYTPAIRYKKNLPGREAELSSGVLVQIFSSLET